MAVLLTESWFSIYFGDKQDDIYKDYYLRLDTTDTEILQDPHYRNVKSGLQLAHLNFLQQVHGNHGVIISQANQLRPYKTEGDFLITKRSHTGIGIMTADCLPLIFCDGKNKAIGVAHAGWPGTAQQIAEKTIRTMQSEFGTKVADLRVFFGPSAQPCCYEVSEEFEQHFSAFSFKDRLFAFRNNKIYFNLPLCNQLQLQDIGIATDAINRIYNQCTICNSSYFSARRKETGRQITAVALKTD